MRVRFDQDARKEYLEAIVFYSVLKKKKKKKKKETGRFVDESRRRLRELEDGIRRYRVPRFPYSIL